MHHQFGVSSSDAEAMMFLWQEDLSQSDPEVYQMLVHIFGGKDSPSSANYALKKTGIDNFDHYSPSTIESVLKLWLHVVSTWPNLRVTHQMY